MDLPSYHLAAERLLSWYGTHYRPLPWRRQPTPYRVWISEIMLQQTRIEAVMPYYVRFMERLPDVQALASVSEDELMKLWEGLGYYSRARNLQKAAKLVCEQHDGQLPADYTALLTLPGIGEYTAGAIASIAYNIPAVAVDGNVMRVLSRLVGDDTDVLSSKAKAHYGAIAQKMLSKEQPGRFNQALMELGETVCLPKTSPDCDSCPWKGLCVAEAADLTDQLPVRSKKSPRRIEKRRVAVCITPESPSRILLHKRPQKGLLAGLWELPNATTEEPLLPEAIAAHCHPLANAMPQGKHIFSHVEWHMTGELYVLEPNPLLPTDYVAVTLAQLRLQYALPSAFRLYAAILPNIMDEEE